MLKVIPSPHQPLSSPAPPITCPSHSYPITCPSYSPTPHLPSSSPCRRDTKYHVKELYHALNRFEHGEPLSDGEDQFVSPSLQKGETKKASLKQAEGTGVELMRQQRMHAFLLCCKLCAPLSDTATSSFEWTLLMHSVVLNALDSASIAMYVL